MIGILMHIFEHLMDILVCFKNIENKYFKKKINYLFFNYYGIEKIVFCGFNCIKTELITIFKRFNIEPKENDLFYITSEHYTNILNMMIKCKLDELMMIFIESFGDNDFSEIKYRHIKKDIKRNEIKIYHIHHLLKLIDKIKIFIWKHHLTDLVCDKYLFEKNIFYYLPNKILEQKNKLLKELMVIAWHPCRFKEWCLDIDEYKDLN